MSLPRDSVLLRIFVGENAKHGQIPIYEALVQKALAEHMAGATVLRGSMGFGHSSRLHTTKILRLANDLPLVVEIVDTEEKVAGFLPHVEALVGEHGLVTLEKVQVLQYGPTRHQKR